MSCNVLTIPCCDNSSGLRDPGSQSVGSASPGASIARVHFTVQQSATGSQREQGPEADNREREAVIRGDITEARHVIHSDQTPALAMTMLRDATLGMSSQHVICHH